MSMEVFATDIHNVGITVLCTEQNLGHNVQEASITIMPW